MNDNARTSRLVYDGIVSLFGGAALGWFGWWFLDGYGSDSNLPLVVWELAGVVVAFVLARWLRSRSSSGRSRWIHLLWIPVALFVLLMVAVIMALRNWQ